MTDSDGVPRSARLLRGAVAIALATLLARVLGFGEKLALAAAFGTDWRADAWFVAFSIPIALWLLVRELIEPAFLPHFAGHLAGGREDRAGALFRLFAKGIGALTVLAALGVAVFAGPVTRSMAPGFSAEALDATATAIRWGAPSIVFLGLSTLTYISLNGYRRFAVPALGDLALKAGPLFACVLLAGNLGVTALAVGVVAGGFGRLAVHGLGLGTRAKSLLTSPAKVPREELVAVGMLLGPLVLGAVFTNVSDIFDNYFSSKIGEGGVSARSFAKKLRDLPLEMVAYATSVVLFPTFARLAASKATDDLGGLFGRAAHGLAALFAPLTAVLYFLAPLVVSTALERGAFGPEDRAKVAFPLQMYAIGLVPFAIENILVNLWFGLKDTLTPIVVGLAGVALNIALCALLVEPMGPAGVALALTISKSAKVLVLTALLARKGLAVPLGPLLRAALGIAAAALASGLAARAFAGRFAVELGEMSIVHRAATLGVGGLLVAAVFAAAFLACGRRERDLVRDGFAMLRAALPGRR